MSPLLKLITRTNCKMAIFYYVYEWCWFSYTNVISSIIEFYPCGFFHCPCCQLHEYCDFDSQVSFSSMNSYYNRFHKNIIHVIYSSLNIIHLLPLSAILVLKFNAMHVWISIWMYFHFIRVVHLMHEHSSIFHWVSIWPTIYMVNFIYECTIQFICIENFIQKIVH
jgi:hypothetical protein